MCLQTLRASLSVLGLFAALVASEGCGGVTDATPAPIGNDASVRDGSTGAQTGSASSGGGSSGSSGMTGSSTGGSGCPGPSSVSCSVEGQVCHYDVGGGQGPTDCGCVGGAWQCYSGCSISSALHDVNPAQCQPQLQSTTTCHPYGPVCGFSVEVPCLGDAGLPPAAMDAGSCAAWCTAVKPPDFPGTSTCLSVELVDGGAALVAQCAGCGI
jgi:hypothetical protein